VSIHPPLCPKTKEAFTLTEFGWRWTVPGCIGEFCDQSPAVRRFVARYQACAWLDRADRWQDVRDRSKYSAHHDRLRDICVDEWLNCESRAKQWRKWESKNESSR
jgi:hypothetical protein